METVQASSGPVAGFVAFVVSAIVQLVLFRQLRLAVAAATGIGVGLALWALEALQQGRAEAQRARALQGLEPRELATRMPWATGSPPDLRTLQRVVPIGETRTLGGTAVSLLSLEVYAEGSIVNSRVSGQMVPASRSRLRWLPNLILSASDDRGRHYMAWPTSGSGDGVGWRSIHVFGPPLDPAATELRLEVESIEWSDLGQSGEGSIRVERGPWTFVVAI